MGTQKEYNSISCGGRPFALSIKRAIHSEDIGVSLLGILKVRTFYLYFLFCCCKDILARI